MALTIMGVDGVVTPEVMEKLQSLSVRLLCHAHCSPSRTIHDTGFVFLLYGAICFVGHEIEGSKNTVRRSGDG